MAWRTIDGREYFYRSIRVDGQPRSIYVGTSDDDLAREIARDILRDVKRRARLRRRARREAEARRAEMDRLLSVLALGELLEHLVLELAGFHHIGRHWRRKRMSKSLAKTTAEPNAIVPVEDEAGRAALVARVQDSWKALSERRRAGDRSMLPQVRAMFGAMDEETLDAFGSAARRAEDGLLAAVYGVDDLMAEAAREKLARIRDELAGPDPSPSERLLAERAAYCWLVLNTFEATHATVQGLTIAGAAFQQKRIDMAHRRFLATIKALALVRRAMSPGPAVRVDICQSVTVEGARPV